LPYVFQNNPNDQGNKRGGGDRRQNIDCETYLHRVGRTARFGDQGAA